VQAPFTAGRQQAIGNQNKMDGSVIDHTPEKIGVAMRSGLRRSPGNRPFSARISRQPAAPRRHPSHAFCVEPLDLASVSPRLRSVSNSVRRMHPSVSANLRRKSLLIARRAVHHCAPLHLPVRLTWKEDLPRSIGFHPRLERGYGFFCDLSD
jgi:hypothetical protein